MSPYGAMARNKKAIDDRLIKELWADEKTVFLTANISVENAEFCINGKVFRHIAWVVLLKQERIKYGNN